MKKLTHHQVNPLNKTIQIEAVGPAASGGAYCHYRIEGIDISKSQANVPEIFNKHQIDVVFHSGEVDKDNPQANGVTHEALLAILIDRLECLQAGPYSCYETSAVLHKLYEASFWLSHRTKIRTAQGVEGLHRNHA